MKGLMFLVGLLAITPAAFGQSTIIHSDYDVWGGPEQQFVDVNQDGTVDFTLESRWVTTLDIPPSFMSYSFGIRPGQDNYVLGSGSTATVLSQGETISPVPIGSTNWQHPKYGSVGVCGWSADLRNETWSGWLGPMAGLDEVFVGLRFSAADGDHFGWARVRLNSSDTLRTAQLVDYAYDTRPNAQILAGAVPEPSSVALLAVGVVGVWLFARKKRCAVRPQPPRNG